MAKSSILFIAIALTAYIAVANAASLRVARQAIPREFQNINIENYLKVRPFKLQGNPAFFLFINFCSV